VEKVVRVRDEALKKIGFSRGQKFLRLFFGFSRPRIILLT
jgi:hypothetical protein